MESNIITLFRNKIQADPNNQLVRRVFHENYEWLERFLKHYGKNEIDKFSAQYNEYYWALENIQALSRELSLYSPVKSSSFNFQPTNNILKATFYLRDLFGHQLNNGEKNYAIKWQKPPIAAVLTIIKQIRDNLFHGMKMDLEEQQYERNKELIRISGEITTIILDRLDDATIQMNEQKIE